MKNNTKLLVIFCLLFNFIFLNISIAQETSPKQRNGYRIHAMYADILVSIPSAELKKYVPAGAGFDFGSLFMLHKTGFANSLVNVGIKAEWLNAETNIPYSDLDEDEPEYSFAVAGNYGPMVTFNPMGAMYVDLFYTPGWGFRMFPNSKAVSNDDIDPSVPHLSFSQALGFHFRYKALKTGLALRLMSNKNFANGAYINPVRSITFSVGICGWKIR